MIDRAAKAGYEALTKRAAQMRPGAPFRSWEDLPEEQREMQREATRAVIAALKQEGLAERAEQKGDGWRTIESAPKDGSKFWGKVDDDAIAMLWHPTFQAFVSSWRQMTMHNRWTFEDGSTTKDHSPVIHRPTAWMPIPEQAAANAAIAGSGSEQSERVANPANTLP